MSSRMIKFIVALVVLGAICCYLFYLNPEPITVTYKPGTTVQAPLAIVLITVFFLGALLIGSISFVVTALNNIEWWKRERRIKLESTNRELLITGREQLAAGEFAEARNTLERITTKEPSNVLAWLGLAEVHEKLGQPLEAIRVLDQARLFHKTNLELLFRIAKLNERQGNYTASYDNLALVLSSHPGNTVALKQIVQCCKKLSRYEQGINFVRELLRKLSAEAGVPFQNELAELETQQALQRASDPAARRAVLMDILKRHKNASSAMNQLAILERDEHNIPEATKWWSKAFSSSLDTRYLREMAMSWLSLQDPSKAISSTKSAVLGSRSAAERNAGDIFLIDLYLHLEMLEEAARELEALKRTNISGQIKLEAKYLEARLLARQAKYDQSARLLASLMSDDKLLLSGNLFRESDVINGVAIGTWFQNARAKVQSGEPPSPILSTP